MTAPIDEIDRIFSLTGEAKVAAISAFLDDVMAQVDKFGQRLTAIESARTALEKRVADAKAARGD